MCWVGFGDLFCPGRIASVLVDAGANTSSELRLIDDRTVKVVFTGTVLDLVNRNIREKRVPEENATEEDLNNLQGIRRLLLRVDAAHAASWRWPASVSSAARVAEGSGRDTATPIPLTSMLPTLRRRARSPRVLLAALSRYSSKP